MSVDIYQHFWLAILSSTLIIVPDWSHEYIFQSTLQLILRLTRIKEAFATKRKTLTKLCERVEWPKTSAFIWPTGMEQPYIETHTIGLGCIGSFSTTGKIEHVPRFRAHRLSCLIGDLELSLGDNLHFVTHICVHQRWTFFQTKEVTRDGLFSVVLVARFDTLVRALRGTGWWSWMKYLEKISPRKAFPFATNGGLKVAYALAWWLNPTDILTLVYTQDDVR